MVRKILASFSWAKFQPPTVTPAGDGVHYKVIDGQHRVAAAVQHTQIDQVPVYIVHAPELADQANSFVSINSDRIKVHQLPLYHAKLAAGDKDALKVKEVCDEAGVTIPRSPAPKGETKPRETAAVQTIFKGIGEYGEAAVIAGLMAVADAYEAESGSMQSAVLKGVFAFFHTHGIPQVDRDVLIKALRDTSNDELQEGARAYAGVYGGTKAAAMVASITRHYNDALPRKNRLTGASA